MCSTVFLKYTTPEEILLFYFVDATGFLFGAVHSNCDVGGPLPCTGV